MDESFSFLRSNMNKHKSKRKQYELGIIWSIHCFLFVQKTMTKALVCRSRRTNSNRSGFVQIQCDRENLRHDRMMCQQGEKRWKALRRAFDTIRAEVVLQRFLDQIVNDIRIMSKLWYFDRQCVTIRVCGTVTQDEGTIVCLLQNIADLFSRSKGRMGVRLCLWKKISITWEDQVWTNVRSMWVRRPRSVV